MDEDCSWKECGLSRPVSDIVLCLLIWQTKQWPPGNFCCIRDSLGVRKLKPDPLSSHLCGPSSPRNMECEDAKASALGWQHNPWNPVESGINHNAPEASLISMTNPLNTLSPSPRGKIQTKQNPPKLLAFFL